MPESQNELSEIIPSFSAESDSLRRSKLSQGFSPLKLGSSSGGVCCPDGSSSPTALGGVLCLLGGRIYLLVLPWSSRLPYLFLLPSCFLGNVDSMKSLPVSKVGSLCLEGGRCERSA
jgi:hypothetical protein